MKPAEVVDRLSASFRRDEGYTFGDDPSYEFTQRRLAAGVGAVAFGLPWALLLASREVCFRDSISHYYYSALWGDVFVAALAFIATFLIAFRGNSPTENAFTWFAGFATMGIALIPTRGHGCDHPPFTGRLRAEVVQSDGGPLILSPYPSLEEHFASFGWAAVAHYLCAAVLFGFLAFYCLAVLRDVIDERHRGPDGRITRVKRVRNAFYTVSGHAIIVAMGVLGTKWVLQDLMGLRLFPLWDRWNVTFWLEAAVLWAFGVAWLVKGRFFGLALRDPGRPA